MRPLPPKPPPVARQGTLPFLRSSQGRAVHAPEAAVQANIVRELRKIGYEVLETSEHRKRERCPKCGASIVSNAGRGCDKGIPDLLVTHESWPEGSWAGLEIKGHSTQISPEQRDLYNRFRVFIVYSLSQALDALARVEFFLFPEP
jgi:hypothetical protein